MSENPYQAPENADRRRRLSLIAARGFKFILSAGVIAASLSLMFMTVFQPAERAYDDFIGGVLSPHVERFIGLTAIRVGIGGVIAAGIGWLGRWISVAIANESRRN
ncbi:MAG: hypothetical protein KF708_11315 [Pirellulales bacterium]|nr:hypothetical protein [Pirellulales bacterium]